MPLFPIPPNGSSVFVKWTKASLITAQPKELFLIKVLINFLFSLKT